MLHSSKVSLCFMFITQFNYCLCSHILLARHDSVCELFCAALCCGISVVQPWAGLYSCEIKNYCYPILGETEAWRKACARSYSKAVAEPGRGLRSECSSSALNHTTIFPFQEWILAPLELNTEKIEGKSFCLITVHRIHDQKPLPYCQRM